MTSDTRNTSTIGRDKNPLPRDLASIEREITFPLQHTPREVEAFPGTRDADFPPWPTHPSREVLKMAYGIPEKSRATIRRLIHNPLQSSVRPRPFYQDRIIVLYVGGKGLIELQDRLCRFPRQPMPLRESQSVQIERVPAIRSMPHRLSWIVVREKRARLHGVRPLFPQRAGISRSGRGRNLLLTPLEKNF